MMQQFTSRPIRVAFVDISRVEWSAGIQYLKNLFFAIKSVERHRSVEVLLLTSPHKPAEYRNELVPFVDQIIFVPGSPLWVNRVQHFISRIQVRTGLKLGYDPLLSLTLRKHKVDLVFVPSESVMLFSGVVLGWITDFQHLYIPNFFSAGEIQERNQRFAWVAHHANRIIVSSQNALTDLQRFSPQFIHKARVLSFVAQVPPSIYKADSSWVCNHYHLPQKFIYLPNQFWRHKNHRIVIEALALARQQNPEITIVCTGIIYEPRDPLHLANLMSLVSVNNLRNNFIVLGMVPYNDLLQLIRQSIALLQPSLFEGWSTTVEEAKSVGKRVILSNIPVHVEQAPDNAIYFDPYNPKELADCLVKVYNGGNPGPDYELEALARKKLPQRTRDFGQTFLNILEETVRRSYR
ncbi:MAG: glycosyltransferase [Chloroflexi bacterium]|nr:glycosyltransferase [Chloroflexota bacterium]